AAGEFRSDIARALRRAREEGLSWLQLDGAELTEIPEKVFDLTDLKNIDLSGNRLKTIPERLWDLPRLEHVNLIVNPLESLPNRPGLTIDGLTYRRCRDQIDAKNIRLVIGVDTPQEDEDFWAAEL